MEKAQGERKEGETEEGGKGGKANEERNARK